MTAYLVMEFIPLTAHPPDIIDRIAKALACLASVPPPAGHSIGPLGGGYIRHRFFQDSKAPLRFTNVESLERYLYRVRPYFHKHPPFANVQPGLGVFVALDYGQADILSRHDIT